MALLGVLSLLQVAFLPGYLLLRATRTGAGILATAVLSFALSLVVNHILVAGLVVLGVYRPATIYAIFTAELALGLWLDRNLLRSGLREAAVSVGLRFRAFVGDLLSGFTGKSKLLPAVLLGAAILVIAGFAISGIVQAGCIFREWDAVVSWNRWAVDWAGNRLPYATSIYPQLLPTNISLCYVFAGTSDVWIFAKAFQFLFCLALLVAMLDLARLQRHFGYVLGVMVTYGLLVACLRFRMLASGYADVPLAFFGFASVYALALAGRAADANAREKFLLVGALLAAGAAMTKQTGLFAVAVYPILAWRFTIDSSRTAHRPFAALRARLPALSRIVVIMAVLVGPWYLYKLYDIHAGNDSNNTALLLTDFHEGRPLPARMLHAAAAIAAALTPLGAALVSVAIACSIRHTLARWLVGLWIVPLGVLWAAAFSYDLRNMAIVLPFAGAAVGVGIVELAVLLVPRSGEVGIRLPGPDGRPWVPWPGPTADVRLRVGHAAGVLFALILLIAACIRDETLLALQQRQQREVGISSLNQQLYCFLEANPGVETVATDYQAMRWLPELGARGVICTCHELSAFRHTFDRPEIRHILIRRKGAAPEVREFLNSRAGVRLVFEDHGFEFYEKRAGQAICRLPVSCNN